MGQSDNKVVMVINSMSSLDFSKWVTPEQIADTMAFLASDSASAISGQVIGVYNKI